MSARFLKLFLAFVLVDQIGIAKGLISKSIGKTEAFGITFGISIVVYAFVAWVCLIYTRKEKSE